MTYKKRWIYYNNINKLNILINYYNIKLLRKYFKYGYFSHKHGKGSARFMLFLKKLSYFQMGGALRRTKKKRNNLNQTISFISRVSKNRVTITCPVQFNGGFAL